MGEKEAAMADKTTDDAGDEEGVKSDPGLAEQGKRALETERKARRKAEADAKAAQDELAALKTASDTSKTETEKLAAKLAELEQRARTAELNALRVEVAQAKGLPARLAARLAGATRDELEADADDLLQVVKPNEEGAKSEGEEGGAKSEGEEGGAKPAPGSSAFGGTPAETLKPGASNTDDDMVADPEKLADSILSSGF